jgi:hypothetical protein
LIRLSDFGCSLVRSAELGGVCCKTFGEAQEKNPPTTPVVSFPEPVAPQQDTPLIANMVDTALVRRAIRENRTIKTGARPVITPLALELARKHGLQIIN